MTEQKKPEDIALVVDATSHMHASATANFIPDVKTGMSQRHLNAARSFLGHAESLESADRSSLWPRNRWEEAQHNATAAVLLAVAALEASINEIYLDCIDYMEVIAQGGRIKEGPLHGLSQPQIKELATAWPDLESERKSILEKHGTALAACGKERFVEDDSRRKAADGLIKLRNALTHYKPEWSSHLKTHLALEKRIANLFAPCALTSGPIGEMTWFPHKCLGAGCAAWSIQTVIEYSDAFCDRLGIPHRFT